MEIRAKQDCLDATEQCETFSNDEQNVHVKQEQ